MAINHCVISRLWYLEKNKKILFFYLALLFYFYYPSFHTMNFYAVGSRTCFIFSSILFYFNVICNTVRLARQVDYQSLVENVPWSFISIEVSVFPPHLFLNFLSIAHHAPSNFMSIKVLKNWRYVPSLTHFTFFSDNYYIQ